ncbi:HPr family phosphocarrier protein [Halalkalibacter okhensis]|uniref:Phosphocarrier HPr family protein n=1 Tax=Halalkalibacter okhensis TaxID=333138 RepID=A0A0B0IBS1_9BACI|nr:HPr family phosphocarrier protein [Halalkalibacter okhensis]KHF38740.1 phosphocarrier HPr family protein [Halalkalibacter okhensis]
MATEHTQEVVVNISEEQTITGLSELIQPYQSEIYLKKLVRGTVHEVNLKSFLGLITLQMRNGDKITVRAIGEDSEAAINKVVEFLT